MRQVLGVLFHSPIICRLERHAQRPPRRLHAVPLYVIERRAGLRQACQQGANQPAIEKRGGELRVDFGRFAKVLVGGLHGTLPVIALPEPRVGGGVVGIWDGEEFARRLEQWLVS